MSDRSYLEGLILLCNVVGSQMTEEEYQAAKRLKSGQGQHVLH